MFNTALDWHPHAADLAGKEEGKRLVVQCTDSSLLCYGIPPGRFLMAEITCSIHPNRLMACFLKNRARAIIGLVRAIDAKYFRIGNLIFRFSEVECFGLLFEIRQRATQL